MRLRWWRRARPAPRRADRTTIAVAELVIALRTLAGTGITARSTADDEV